MSGGDYSPGFHRRVSRAVGMRIDAKHDSTIVMHWVYQRVLDGGRWMIRLIAVLASVVCLWLLAASLTGRQWLNRWDRNVRHAVEVLRAVAQGLRHRCLTTADVTLRTAAGGTKSPLIPTALGAGFLALSLLARPHSPPLAVAFLLIVVIISPYVIYLLADVFMYVFVGVVTVLLGAAGLFLISLLWIMAAPYHVLDEVTMRSPLRRMIYLAGLLLSTVGAALADS